MDGFDKRVTIIAGHYGSGKSEIAVNTALQMKIEGQRVSLVDMDIVNPFFRSFDAKTRLEDLDIKVVAPLYANTNVDVPALLPVITSSLHDPELRLIVDLGGDEDGARVLGRYHLDIDPAETSFLAVVNCARPMTRTAKEAIQYINTISEAARLPVTHIIANTHYMNETSLSDVLHGLAVAREVAAVCSCKVAAVCVMEGMDIPKGATGETSVMYLKKTMRSV